LCVLKLNIYTEYRIPSEFQLAALDPENY